MLRGFLNNTIVSAEEYLIDYELRTSDHVDVNHNLLKTSIRFDNQEVDAFILDVIDDRLIVQLVLPLKEKFDDNTNVYKNSYIRKLLNLDNFLSRFNKEFIEHIKLTKVHTEDYITIDKLWLLSHEEVGQDINFLRKHCDLRRNNNCQLFDLFEHIDLRSYSQVLLKLNKQKCHGWRLRSIDSNTFYDSNSRFVGCVNYTGDIESHFGNHYYSFGAICPACTIC